MRIRTEGLSEQFYSMGEAEHETVNCVPWPLPNLETPHPSLRAVLPADMPNLWSANTMTTTPTPPAGASDAAMDAFISDAVNRFLAWRLPEDFAPDCGISFKPITNPAWTHDLWPSGTNLFHAGQARAMFEHCLEAALTSKAEGADARTEVEWLSIVRERDALIGELATEANYSGYEVGARMLFARAASFISATPKRYPALATPPAPVAGSGGLPYAESLAKWCDVQADDPDNKDGAVTLLAIAETLRAAAKALAAQPAPSGEITIRCPKCKKTMTDKRRDTDYHDTHTVEIVCPDCDDGDFHSELHFDASGKTIVRDPSKEPTAQPAPVVGGDMLRKIDWIIEQLDAPDRAARSHHRGIAAIKHVAEQLKAALSARPAVENSHGS